MLVRPDRQARPPIDIRWTWDGILRVFLAPSIAGWGFVLREFSLLRDKTPVIEDSGLSYAIRSERVELWLAPVVGLLVATVLLLPSAAVRKEASRALAASLALALTATAGVILAWVAPVQAYREATLYEQPSWGNVSITALVFVTPAAIALAAAVVMLMRAAIVPSGTGLRVLGLCVAAGIAVLVGLSGLGAWLEADRGHTGYESIARWSTLALGGVGLMVLLAGAWHKPVVVRSLIVLGLLMALTAALLSVPGLIGASVCVFGDSHVAAWACGPALLLLCPAQYAFLAGWILYAGTTIHSPRSSPNATEHRPPNDVASGPR